MIDVIVYTFVKLYIDWFYKW